MVMRQRCGNQCGNYVKNHSKKAMVPGAGIEPARLSAGDFESPARQLFTLGIFGGLNCRLRYSTEHEQSKQLAVALYKSTT